MELFCRLVDLTIVAWMPGLNIPVPNASTIAPAMKRATKLEGIAFCPETAACVVAAEQLVRDGLLRPDERDQVLYIAESEPLPSHCVVVRKGLPRERTIVSVLRREFHVEVAPQAPLPA